MPESKEATSSVTGARKAAMFLMGVGDQIGADVLRHLEPDEIRQITHEISTLHAVEPHHMLGVFREFETLAASSQFFAKGGAECARRLVEQALGPEPAQKILQAPVPTEAPQASPEIEMLQETDPQQLAAFVREEHPQVIALILASLPLAQAGAVMSSLPEAVQPLVAIRMASLDRISPQVFKRIAEAIGAKVKNLRQVKRPDGLHTLASLLNQLDPAAAESILAKMDEHDQAIGTSVRDMMFIFDDILNINKEGMTKLIAKADRKVLTTALKGTLAKMRDHFKECMSQRAAEMLEEDMEALGPVRIRDVETAQQQLVAVVRQLQQEGALYVSRGGSDEYVV
ncbi:MAG TPA: flagellar motor switch protein FliG [Bryobacteraceae bacterium]|nr:flagellar motor switch protein FliG [Bryobacteraceae bacterium]